MRGYPESCTGRQSGRIAAIRSDELVLNRERTCQVHRDLPIVESRRINDHKLPTRPWGLLGILAARDGSFGLRRNRLRFDHTVDRDNRAATDHRLSDRR